MNSKKIILPSDFTIDDVAGFYFYLQANDCGINEVDVRFYTHEMIGQTFDDNVYLIDCGPNDYKLRGKGCATSVVSADFDIEPDEALKKLIEVLTRNNQTGFLREHSFSLPFTIRYLTQIKRDPLLVLREALEVIDTYLKLKRTRKFDIGEAKELTLESKILKAVNDEMETFLVEYRGGKKMEYHVFTLPWYIAARMILDDKIGDIRDSARFWLDIFLAIEKARKEAKKLLEGEGQKCFVEVNGNYWFVAKTDNQFITEYVFKYCAVAIVKNPKTGNVAILTARRMFDMSKVAEALNKRESGIWYYNNRKEEVLNGSLRRPQLPTSLTIAKIFEIVKENII